MAVDEVCKKENFKPTSYQFTGAKLATYERKEKDGRIIDVEVWVVWAQPDGITVWINYRGESRKEDTVLKQVRQEIEAKLLGDL